MNVKFKASARTTALHRTGAGRQRNPTAPVGGEVFSLDIPFHRTDCIKRAEGVPLIGKCGAGPVVQGAGSGQGETQSRPDNGWRENVNRTHLLGNISDQ